MKLVTAAIAVLLWIGEWWWRSEEMTIDRGSGGDGTQNRTL